MANRLADLNRQKRDVAYSGRASIGDVPWLYALQAEQAAANAPAGIGDGGGNAMAEGAPNPMALGGGGSGGASGGADTGLPGPGQLGLGEDIDQLYRQWSGGEGSGGAVDRGLNGEHPYADPMGFGTVGSIGGYMTGIPGLGLVGAGVGAAYDYQLAKQFDPAYSFGLGSFLSSLGNIASGGYIGDSQLNESIGGYQDATGTGLNRDALAAGVTGGGYSGPKGVSGGIGGDRNDPRGYDFSAFDSAGVGVSGSSWSGGLDDGPSYAKERAHPERAGRDGGGAGNDPQGHGGGGSLGSDRDTGFGGPRHDGGMVYGAPGEEVDHTLLAGEGVLTPEAVEALGGPGFIHGVNMMARMMRGRR